MMVRSAVWVRLRAGGNLHSMTSRAWVMGVKVSADGCCQRRQERCAVVEDPISVEQPEVERGKEDVEDLKVLGVIEYRYELHTGYDSYQEYHEYKYHQKV
jgi:hypothetical protein